MIPFGFSIGDILLVAQIVRTCYRSCKDAGPTYNELAHLAWTLGSVLGTIEREMLAGDPNSPLSQNGGAAKRQLAEVIRGCEGIVEEITTLLDSYGGLDDRREGSRMRRVWDRARWSVGQVEKQIEGIGRRLTMGIMGILLQLDVMQIGAATRVQNTLDVTRREMREGMRGVRTAMWEVVERVRVRQSHEQLRREENVRDENQEDGTGDRDSRDEEWADVKRELRALGFGKREIKRSKRVIMAYIREQALSNLEMSVRSSSRNSERSRRSRGRRRTRRVRQPGNDRVGNRSSEQPPPYRSHDGDSTAPPPYSSRSRPRWSSSSTVLVSPQRSRSRRFERGRYGASRAQPRSGLTTEQMVLFGVAVASVSFIALDHYQRRRRRERRDRSRYH